MNSSGYALKDISSQLSSSDCRRHSKAENPSAVAAINEVA